MNDEETKEAIKVMQAFVEGKRVVSGYGQVLEPHGCCYPDWNWTKGLGEYVIAPEPREFNIVICARYGRPVGSRCITCESGLSSCRDIKVREVTNAQDVTRLKTMILI